MKLKIIVERIEFSVRKLLAKLALVILVDILRAARDKRAMAVVVTTSIESDIMDTRRDSKVIPAVNGASGYSGFAS